MARVEGQENADCIFVVALGDGLASDPELASWARQGSSPTFGGSSPFDAIVVSDVGLEIASERASRPGLANTGLPLVSANAIREDTGDLLVAPYGSADCAGYSVAFIGLSQTAALEGVLFLRPLPAIEGALQDIERRADIVVLLSNAGPETDRTIASQVEGIDVIVGCGEPPREPERAEHSGTLIVRAGYPGRLRL